jgi:hypothetical protein
VYEASLGTAEPFAACDLANSCKLWQSRKTQQTLTNIFVS